MIALAASFWLAGCATDDSPPDADPSGQVTVATAGGAYPFAQAAADQFQIEHPAVAVSISQTSPNTAYRLVCRGRVDLTVSDRALPTSPAQGCERRIGERHVPDGGTPPRTIQVIAGSRPSVAADALGRFIEDYHEGIADAADDVPGS